MIFKSVLSLYIPEFKRRTTRALLEILRKRCCCPVFTEVCQGFVFVLLCAVEGLKGEYVSQLHFPEWLLNRIMWGCTFWRHFKVIFCQCVSQ